MQVFIDWTDVLVETNKLDNEAIRPFIDGDFTLPGDIYIDAQVNPAISYVSANDWLTVSGVALYRHTAVKLQDSSCAGSTVTLTVPSSGATYNGYTDNHGHYNISFLAPVSGGNYNVSLAVTDYTLNGDTTASFQLIPICDLDLSAYLTLSQYTIIAGQSITGNYSVSNVNCANVDTTILNTWSSPGSNPSSGFSFTTNPLNSGETQYFDTPSLTFPNPGTFNVCVQANADYRV